MGVCKKLSLVAISLILFKVLSCSEPLLEVYGNLEEPLFLVSGNLSKQLEMKSEMNFDEAIIAGNDETAVRIRKDAFHKINLIYDENGFHSKADSLPEVCNIKNIAHICFSSPYKEKTLFHLQETSEIARVSPFEYFLADYEKIGESRKNGYRAVKLKKKKQSEIFNLVSDNLILVLEDGQEILVDKSGFYQHFRFEGSFFSWKSLPIAAVWENYPEEGMKDLFTDIRDTKSPLLIILIDSLGWKFLQYLKSNEPELFLSKTDFAPLRAVYPPDTENNLLAFSTGIKSDKSHAELFPQKDFPDQSGLIITDDKMGFSSSFRIIRSNDENADGHADDEIYLTALDNLTHHDFIFVHLHSIDGTGYKFGAYSNERIVQAKEVDKYVESLVANWKGEILLFSDHGMHTEFGKGVHYRADEDDMVAVYCWLKKSDPDKQSSGSTE
ncbi:MAG: alkaline phosphatase family protein [Candidatus Cloacimonetes bacterium]|nr:alkaline phosphatase family protein [Candidatus Cloacimonadota bacterium]